ncbi:MAG TPA: S4 domain-containing protein, partial [Methylotenera sp.]|nr:S4 domain-containing protein [Methylotenera sp.]
MTASKAPLRRADPAKRDRSVAAQHNKVAPPKPAMSAIQDAPSKETPSKQSQRNHRHDGKPYGYSPAEVSNESRASDNRSLRSDLRARTAAEPIPPKSAGVDTRVTPRPDKNEPQYRQAPRRGGKIRDGYDGTATPQYGAAAKAAYKSSPVNIEQPRLSKVMAERGICSRREADEWIINGWVKVDGVIIDTLGTRIKPDAEIIISGYAYEQQAEQVTILLHKPV